MRLHIFIYCLLFVLLFGAVANAQTLGTPNTLSSNLSLGSSGPQVLLLQQMLNKDPDTQIAQSGAGSPGHESEYFGSLTQAAVMRFQAKYASEVLTPVGLSLPNGYVGSYTRAKLARIVSNTTAELTPNPTPPPLPLLSEQATSTNPNLEHASEVMADLDAIAVKNEISAARISSIKSIVMQQLATTTDLRKAFLQTIPNVTAQATRSQSLLSKAITQVHDMLDALFMPQKAYASAGTPFGGKLLAAIPCMCSGTWFIVLQPLPPTYATVLTYVPFTQAFSSHNIPFTSALLGNYIPRAGVCVVYAVVCVNISDATWGMITPMVGSSL